MRFGARAARKSPCSGEASVKYVLDTNAVALVMKGDASALAHLERAARTDVFLPQPVVAEVEYGIQRLPRSKRRELLAERWALIASQLQRATWSDDVSRHFGAIKAKLERTGQRVEDMDVAIAAHALSLDATLASANFKHFSRIPELRVRDWSAAP